MKIEGQWAGTETSLKNYIDAEANIDAKMAAGISMSQDDQDEEKPYDIIGGVAVLPIRGPLTNRDSLWNSLFGITSYNSIREALSVAAEDPDVHHILLDVDSGGGAVAGAADTAQMIRMINDKVKPVTSFTSGSMYSAAYWLGSSAGKVYADQTAGVGSIGVIATHMSYARQLDKEGIDATVIRAGKYKALASSVEPLSEDAKAGIQAQLDQVYKVFVGNVASMRSKSYEFADSVMAQGREFIGTAALDASLIDGIQSFDELLLTLTKSIDTSKNFMNNGSNSLQGDPMKRRALSEAVIAAMAEGGVVVPEAAVEAPVEQVAPVEPAAVVPPTEGELTQEEANESAAIEGTVPEVKESSADLVAYLQSQVRDKDADLLAAKVEIEGLKKSWAEAQASHEGLLEIAKKSVRNMRVALGGQAVDLSGSSAEAVLQEHTSLSVTFAEKYKAGGVAAVDASNPQKTEHRMDPIQKARVAAVRFSK